MSIRRWLGGIVVLGVLLGPGYGSALTREEARLAEAYQTGQIVRLHVLAEDDSPEMQALKLCVRDAVLLAFQRTMGGADAEAVYGRLVRGREAMRQVAQDTARGLGFEGEVRAEVGWLALPEKKYGAVVLPEGEYRGLRIVLGRGEGRNWWCVLFPALCLSAASEEPWEGHERVDEERLILDTVRVVKEWVSPPIWEWGEESEEGGREDG